MAPREPGSGIDLVRWALALLLALCVERGLALPEVQKSICGWAEVGFLGSLVSRSPTAAPFPLPASNSDLILEACKPQGHAILALEYSRCPDIRSPRPARKDLCNLISSFPNL